MFDPLDTNPYKVKPFGATYPSDSPGSKKATSKKIATGKKPPKSTNKKPIPKKTIACPYCTTVNSFPGGVMSVHCNKCGKVYFRP